MAADLRTDVLDPTQPTYRHLFMSLCNVMTHSHAPNCIATTSIMCPHIPITTTSNADSGLTLDLALAIITVSLRYTHAISSSSPSLAHVRSRLLTLVHVLPLRSPSVVRCALVLMPWIQPCHVCLNLYVLRQFTVARLATDAIGDQAWLACVRVAAGAGRVDVLAQVFGRTTTTNGKRSMMDVAMQAACTKGNLVVIKWLVQSNQVEVQVTSAALGQAIRHGHSCVLDFIMACSGRGGMLCNRHLLDHSALTGAALSSPSPSTMLAWLARNNLAHFDSSTLAAACTSGTLTLIDLVLGRLGTHVDLASAYLAACKAGHLHVLDHLLHTWSLALPIKSEITTRLVWAAARAGHVDVLAWLVVRGHWQYPSSGTMMSRVRDVRVLAWIVAHFPVGMLAGAGDALAKAASEGNMQVIEWWAGQVRDGKVRSLIGWNEIERMVERAWVGGQVHVLEWVGGQVGVARVVGWVGERVVEMGTQSVECLEWWWRHKPQGKRVDWVRSRVERAIEVAEQAGGWHGYAVGHWWRQRLAALSASAEERLLDPRPRADVNCVKIDVCDWVLKTGGSGTQPKTPKLNVEAEALGCLTSALP